MRSRRFTRYMVCHFPDNHPDYSGWSVYRKRVKTGKIVVDKDRMSQEEAVKHCAKMNGEINED